MLLVLIYLSWSSETGFSLTTGYVFSINVSAKSIAFKDGDMIEKSFTRNLATDSYEPKKLRNFLSRLIYLDIWTLVPLSPQFRFFSIQMSIECSTEGDSSPVTKVPITTLIRSLDSSNNPKSAISIDLSCFSTLLLCTTSVSSIKVKIVKFIYRKEDSNENFCFDSSNSWKILRALLEMLVTLVCLLI